MDLESLAGAGPDLWFSPKKNKNSFVSSLCYLVILFVYGFCCCCF